MKTFKSFVTFKRVAVLIITIALANAVWVLLSSPTEAQSLPGQIGTSQIAPGAIAATANGRAKLANGFFDNTTTADKFADDAFTATEFASGAGGIFDAGCLGAAGTEAENFIAPGGIPATREGLFAMNDSGGAFAPGDLVYVSSYNTASARAEISLAQNDAAGQKAMYVCRSAIGIGASDTVVKKALLVNTALNTAGAAVGDPVYLSAVGTTGNTLTLAAPTAAGSISQRVGSVVIVDATGDVEIDLESADLVAVGSNEIQALSVANAAIANGTIAESKLVAPATPGLGVLRVAHASYNFAVNGGAAAAHTLLGAGGVAVTIPDNAVIVNALYKVRTTFQSPTGDAATIALSVEGANDLVVAAAINVGTAFDATGAAVQAIPDLATVGDFKYTTAARALTLTIGVEAVTAGVLDFWVWYVVEAG